MKQKQYPVISHIQMAEAAKNGLIYKTFKEHVDEKVKKGGLTVTYSAFEKEILRHPERFTPVRFYMGRRVVARLFEFNPKLQIKEPEGIADRRAKRWLK